MMSLKRLIALTALDVVLAVLLGFGFVVLQAWGTSPSATWGTLRALRAVGIPLEKVGLQDNLDEAMRWRYALGALYTTGPEDDSELRDWLRQQELSCPLPRWKVRNAGWQGSTGVPLPRPTDPQPPCWSWCR